MVELKFETITPLHISNGVELAYGLEYTTRNDVFRKFDFSKISQKLSSEKIFNFNNNYTVKEIEKLIDDNFKLFDADDFYFKITITKFFKELIDNPRAVGQKYVKEFINQNGKFYIPGSSVKGALLTILGLNSLGIQAGDNAHITDKFVIRDSEYLPNEDFYVLTTKNRPPSINLICLKPGKIFVINILKNGKFDLNAFKKKLKSYSEYQIENALSKILPYKGYGTMEKGADIFEKALGNLKNIKINDDEYLVNIGFGGGSWFKTFEGEVPMFKSKKRRVRDNSGAVEYEPAHTSFLFELKSELTHIGWCKLKISE